MRATLKALPRQLSARFVGACFDVSRPAVKEDGGESAHARVGPESIFAVADGGEGGGLRGGGQVLKMQDAG